MKKLLAILTIMSVAPSALPQAATNDYILSQKPASGPLVPRAVTPSVGKLIGWPSSINQPGAITLGAGLTLTGSTLSASGGSTTLAGLSDVAITGLAGGDLLQYDGTDWANESVENVMGSNVLAFGNLGNAAGVLTNDGAGVLSYTGISTGGNGAADSGKLVSYDANGGLTLTAGSLSGLWVKFDGDPARSFVIKDSFLSYRTGLTATATLHFPAPPTGTRNYYLPDSSGTVLLGSAANNGSALTDLNASNISTGTVPTARLGSGTANSTTYLRGDNTWQTITSGDTPGGSGSELQYRAGASTLGAVSGSSSANGGITLAPSSGAALTLTGSANTAASTITGTITGGGITRSLLTLSDNWTAATGGTSVPRLLSLEVTHTGGSVNWASTALARIVVNASELLRVDHNASFSWATEGTYVDCDGNKLQLGSTWGFNFAGDAWLYRDAANTMAHRNGTNPQIVRIYETDSGSNDEYIEISAASGTNYIKPAATGTGTASKLDHYLTNTVLITSGTGSPESAITAPVGSLYLRTDGGAATALYVKESGSGNTGWVAK